VFLFVPDGTLEIEIDFQQHSIRGNALLYIHPNQVHRILSADSSNAVLLGIETEHLKADYLQRLEKTIFPPGLIQVDEHWGAILQSTSDLCLSVTKVPEGQLSQGLLQDYSNAIVGLYIGLYKQAHTNVSPSTRYETVTHSFKLLLERNYLSKHWPADYAKAMNLSLPYLNECIRNATGYPVGYHIQQRLILEAKRLLFHTDLSIKEIASTLEFTDQAYFSRLFAKATGITASRFRAKNHG
jgi:AraC-like DNA-binding protein